MIILMANHIKLYLGMFLVGMLLCQCDCGDPDRQGNLEKQSNIKSFEKEINRLVQEEEALWQEVEAMVKPEE